MRKYAGTGIREFPAPPAWCGAAAGRFPRRPSHPIPAGLTTRRAPQTALGELAYGAVTQSPDSPPGTRPRAAITTRIKARGHHIGKSIMLISMNEVCRMTSLSRSAINLARAEGRFPQAVLLGEKRIAFVRSEVEDWIAARIAARPTGKT